MRKRRTSKKLKVKAVNKKFLARSNVLSIDILLDFYNGGTNEKD